MNSNPDNITQEDYKKIAGYLLEITVADNEMQDILRKYNQDAWENYRELTLGGEIERAADFWRQFGEDNGFDYGDWL